MKNGDGIRKIALRTILEEAEAVAKLAKSIDSDFEDCVEMVLNCNGRVIITGIGKSAVIGQKIVGTLNSTGTPASFLHAADAIHGDLGMVQKEDIVICISKSGETPEIKVLVPMLKAYANGLIAMVGNRNSYLARNADKIIDTSVEKEACPNNLAPTSSTTAQLVMGDALSVCLLEARGFTSGDFARLHPGGTLGRQLYLKVADLYTRNEAPRVQEDDNIRKVILEISSSRLGATAVMMNNRLTGIITDGDLRRMLEKNSSIDHLKAKDIMSSSPRTTHSEELVIKALATMREKNITQLLVVDDQQYKGVIHLHDILQEGIL